VPALNVEEELQLAALRSSDMGTSSGFSLEADAPLVEWAD